VLLEGRDAALRAKAARALGERLPLDRHLIVPALVKATQESSAEVRRAAREPMSHGRVGPALPGVIEALREGLDEPEARDRHAVIAALGSQTGYSAEFFADMQRCLRDPDRAVRSTAAYYLADFLRRGERATDELWAALEDPVPEVRRYLVRGLGRVSPGDARVHAVVLDILRDEAASPYQLDDAVEIVALLPEQQAAALLDRAPPRAHVAIARTRFPGLTARGIEELGALLRGTEKQRVEALRAAPKVRPWLDEEVVRAAGAGEPAAVREAALIAVRDLDVPPARKLELVRASIDAADRSVRWAVHQLLGQLPHADVLELCIARLDGPDRDELARALGYLNERGAAAVPRLVQCLEQKPTSTLAYALGSIGRAARAALPALARLTAEANDVNLRTVALVQISRIGLGPAPGDAVLEPLLARADDLQPGVRDAAVLALETIEPPVPARVREALMQSVVREEGQPDVRRRRVLRLAELGPEVTQALVRALEDRDEQVAADALRALERLGAAAVPQLERMRDDPRCADAARAAFVLEQVFNARRPR